MRLCNNGAWVEVTVDDYFPCFEHGGPIFSKANGNELWVLLLEKAYAKLHGNYYNLRDGYVYEGMNDLTGCPTECIDFDNDSVKVSLEDGSLFKKLQTYDNLGYLISASTPGTDDMTEVADNARKG